MVEWYLDPVVWTAIGSIGTFIAAIGVIITLGINKKESKNQEDQLFTANYSLILQQIDSEKAKACRKVLYNAHFGIQKLLDDYSSKKHDNRLHDLNEVAKYTTGIYDAIFFLIDGNEKLRNRLIKHHGFTMGRLWLILKDIHEDWKQYDGLLDYKGFVSLCKESYENLDFKDKIDEFYNDHYLLNDFDNIDDVALRNLTQKISVL